MSDDKKRINLITIEEQTLSLLLNQANVQGKSLGNFVGLLLDEYAFTWKPPAKEEPDRLLFWDWVQAQQEEQKRKMVYQVAAIYQSRKNPTEEEAERLARMCETAGLDYKEVVKEISNDPFSSIVMHSRNGTATGQCMRWLAGVMKDRKRMPVNLIEIKASQKGFSRSTLNRARRAINMDTKSPTIETEKIGKGWQWYIRGEEESEELLKEAISVLHS